MKFWKRSKKVFNRFDVYCSINTDLNYFITPLGRKLLWIGNKQAYSITLWRR